MEKTNRPRVDDAIALTRAATEIQLLAEEAITDEYARKMFALAEHLRVMAAEIEPVSK